MPFDIASVLPVKYGLICDAREVKNAITGASTAPVILSDESPYGTNSSDRFCHIFLRLGSGGC